MSEIEQKAVQLIERFEQLAEELAPEAVDAGLMAVRLDSAGQLISALLFLVASIALAYGALRFYRYTDRMARESDEYLSAWEPIGVVSGCAGAAISFVVGIASVFALLDHWNWIGVFAPELRMTAKVLGL